MAAAAARDGDPHSEAESIKPVHVDPQQSGTENGQLSTWKTIADHLGISIRTAKTYEHKHGMPVHRLPGQKARVWAYPEELEQWRRSHTAVTEEPEPEQSVEPERPRKPRFLWNGVIAAGSMLLALSVGVYYMLVVPHGPMANFQVHSNFVSAVNAGGQELWRHRFGYIQNELGYVSIARPQISWMGDWGKGQKLLLQTAPISISYLGNDVFCFSDSGKVEWTFRNRHSVGDAGGSTMVPPYFVNGIQVLRRRNPADTRIVVSSNHYIEQADQVAVLDTNGHLLAEYWHPGHLTRLGKADLDGDGSEEVILGGVNNGNHQATLVVLDPWSMRGPSTPAVMDDNRFRIIGMPAAKEKAVVFFPRTVVSAKEGYTRVSEVRVLPDRIVVIVAEGMDEGAPHIVYELSYDLRVVALSPDNGVVRRYQALVERGELDHEFNSAESERLKGGVRVIRQNDD